MNPTLARFDGLERPCGSLERALEIGDRALVVRGLAPAQAEALASRWGPWWVASSGLPAAASVRLLDAAEEAWLDAPQPGEVYRVEPLAAGGRLLTLSYAFALEAGPPGGEARLAISSGAAEPPFLTLENGLRMLVARLALGWGGFAMHAAGVLREGRAWLFAGPSRAGKSTLVGLSAPGRSIGDDYGLVLPDGAGGWAAVPLPFDNEPQRLERPHVALAPLAGIWRIFQSAEHRVERLPAMRAAASLASVAVFPSAMPDLYALLLARAAEYCGTGRFAHLHFARDPGFWRDLAADGPGTGK